MAYVNREPLTEYIAFRAGPSERSALEHEAEKLDRPISWVIRLALRAHLESVGQREAVAHG
jgi:hypothetical protein